MQSIGKIKNKKMSCIPLNMEKYLSFSLGNHLTFLHSLQFLNASLEKLVANLSKHGRENFNLLKEHIILVENVDLLLLKGVFPYDYFDSPLKFQETAVPKKSKFFSKLTNDDITDSDYEHAQNVWHKFNIHNLGDYHDLYVMSDTLQLADVFEYFRKISLENYDIDPCHMYTAPGLSWNACLKMSGVRLELFTDPDMYLFIESGIRGGVSQISNRYARANNEYLGENLFDPNVPVSHILFLDVVNLYGSAMVLPLPVDGFCWLSIEEIENLTITNVTDDGNIGYILEVDLDYPVKLHEFHSDYPLAPERLVVDPNKLSEYSKRCVSEAGYISNANDANDVYRDMEKDMHLFDTSGYPPNHFLRSDINKKILGKMKDEFSTTSILEFVGLRSKMYSILIKYDDEKHVGKGISKPILKKIIRHSDYKRCLFENRVTRVEACLIQSRKHELSLNKCKKVGLSPFDDKRYILDNGCDTLAFGHCKIVNNNNNNDNNNANE